MKKFLPKSFKNPQGFTLVELLIVISIIAILAVIGMTIYSGTQQKARDGKRQAEVVAIAKALEANKVSGAVIYPQIVNSWFAGNIVPSEPATSGYAPQYSILYTTATGFTVNKPTTWASSDPTATANGTTPVGGTVTVAIVANGVPAAPSNIYSFQVCTRLETGTAPNIFCVPNTQ